MIKKWVDKVIDISRACGRLIVSLAFIQGNIISVTSVYALQCGLYDSQKDDFYDCLINVNRELGENEVVVIAGELMFTLQVTQKTMRTSNGGPGYGVRNKEDEMNLETCAATNITAQDILFKKREVI